MRVLVTGGTGYIGSHTSVQLIERGHDVVIFDNLSRSDESVLDRIDEISGTRPAFVAVDLRDRTSLATALEVTGQVDACIHFAALKSVRESVEHRVEYFTNNVSGTVNIIEALSGVGCDTLVFSSSCTVYGQPEECPVTEQTPLRPAASPYGLTKQIGEQLLSAAAPDVIAKAVALRYFNPAGAHPSGKMGESPVVVPENLVPNMVHAAAGLRPELNVFGSDYSTPDGTAVRDYLHVMDLADAHVSALEWLARASAGPVEVFNLGAGRGFSVLEAVSAFYDATGVEVPYRLSPRRPGDVEQIWCDPTRALQELGWKTQRTLRDLFADAWRWHLCSNSTVSTNG